MSLAIRALPMAVRGVCALAKLSKTFPLGIQILADEFAEIASLFWKRPKPRWWPLSMATPAIRLSCVTPRGQRTVKWSCLELTSYTRSVVCKLLRARAFADGFLHKHFNVLGRYHAEKYGTFHPA
jgi:hypothetical protein